MKWKLLFVYRNEIIKRRQEDFFPEKGDFIVVDNVSYTVMARRIDYDNNEVLIVLMNQICVEQK